MDKFMEFIWRIGKDTGKGVKGYLKSRLIIMTIMFLILSIGLVIIDVSKPLSIAFIIALIDIVPILGSGIIIIPWAIISYFNHNQDLALGLGILYLVSTILKQFIEPKVLGDQIGIKPLYTFIATILGSIILGPIGLILGPIIAVVINSIIKGIKKD